MISQDHRPSMRAWAGAAGAACALQGAPRKGEAGAAPDIDQGAIANTTSRREPVKKSAGAGDVDAARAAARRGKGGQGHCRRSVRLVGARICGGPRRSAGARALVERGHSRKTIAVARQRE